MEHTPHIDTLRALGSHPLFAQLGEDRLARLGAMARPVSLHAGDVLVTEGAPAGDLFVLLAGRLVASVMRSSGDEAVVGEIIPGEVIGEMSLLSDDPRAATVVAIRDSALLRLPRSGVHDLIVEDSTSLLSMARLLVKRLEAANRLADRPSALQTIALVPAASCANLAAIAERLVTALGVYRSAVIVDRARAGEIVGHEAVDAPPDTPESRRLSGALHELEARGALVVYVAEHAASVWSQRCVRQADRVLVVGVGSGSPELSEAESRAVFDADTGARSPVDLVLTHTSAGPPVGTEHWLARREVGRHHHVRDGQPQDLNRLVRSLTDRSVGLVLSGGGARGLAHVGVMRALSEAGITFDAVGGASFGASVAASVALGWDADRIAEEAVRGTTEGGSLIDFTFPYVAIARGRKLTASLIDVFGDARIEDCAIPYFCVSSDLTAGRLRVHDRGPVVAAVRASTAIPGVFPPMRSADDHVLVDGGVMDNLPVNEMRTRVGAGRVVAIDLRGTTVLPTSDLGSDGAASGWRALGRRLNPMRERLEVPRIVDLLTRSTELAAGDRHDTADIVLRPPVDTFASLDFTAHEAIIAAGYRCAVDGIERGALDPLIDDTTAVV